VATSQATENFPFNTRTLQYFPSLIVAHAYVKKAATKATVGKLHNQFPVDMIQGGADASTNINTNDFIANRAVEYSTR